MERLVEDGSYGLRDILKTRQNYTSFETLPEAESAYIDANK